MTVGLLSIANPAVIPGSGLVIALSFDASWASVPAPTSYTTAANTAASLLMAAFPNTNITVNINLGYVTSVFLGYTSSNPVPPGSSTGGTGGTPTLSYSAIRAQMVLNNRSAAMNTLLANTPAGTTLNGQTTCFPATAVCKALGLFGFSSGPVNATDPAIDGGVVIGSGISSSVLVGVFLHEMTHAMGRVPDHSGPFTFSRFTSVGVRDFGQVATNAYFSLDGGTTILANYDFTLSDPSDFNNGGNGTGNGVQDGNSNVTWDAFDAYYDARNLQTLSTVDIQLMNTMGFQ